MKSKIFLLFILLSVFFSAQSQEKQIANVQQKLISDNIYQLFPTPNIGTFIKLDTRNGKMWQVHFSINSTQYEGQLELNSIKLVSELDETKGRFTLYKTENTYNLLLLDQIDGRVWQVQWNYEISKRFIVRIY